MKTHPIPLGAALLLALFVTGCETDGGIGARTQEKSATYATLKTWQKSFIAKGVVANGFTPDMVYMAMGHPNRVETKDFPQGRAERWTYNRYYPNVDAVHGFRYSGFSTESAYQPQLSPTQNAGGSIGPFAKQVPRGMDIPESSFKTAGPQGGSMEPGDLRSYLIQILFENGKVIQLAASENMN